MASEARVLLLRLVGSSLLALGPAFLGPAVFGGPSTAHAQSDAAASSDPMFEQEPAPTPEPVAEPAPTPQSSAQPSTQSTAQPSAEPAPQPRSRPPTTSASTASTSASTTSTPAEEAPEEEDDGRDVDFIWIEAEGGVSYVNLVAFRNANFAAGDTDVFRESSGTGPMFGAGVGFRVYWLAVGARVTFASYDVFQIGTVGGDLQLRFPIPIFEPYIRVGFGYAWQGGANYADPAMSATTVYGWSFDAALGFDIFLTNWLTIGAGAGFDLLNMTRQRDPLLMPITTFHPEQDGDAVGFQLRGFAQLGLHF